MNAFTNAKPVAAKTPKGKKKDVVTIDCPHLERYAAIQSAIKSLETMLAVEKTKVDEAAFNYFVTAGMKIQSKPDNIEGVDGAATASLQLKSRLSTSGLNDEEVTLLQENNIPIGENVSQEETFIINPEYITNEKLMKRVGETLANVSGIPADYILSQPKIAKQIATDDSIAAVFKIKDEDTLRALLPLVTTQATRAKLAKESDPFAIIDAIMAENEKENTDA